jgi:hypothetical protein
MKRLKKTVFVGSSKSCFSSGLFGLTMQRAMLVALADIPLGVGSSHSNFINLGVLDT